MFYSRLWSSMWLSSSRKQKSTGFPFIQKSQAYSRMWEAAAPFLHCLEVLASLASAPAVSWDILGWGTLSVPWDLLSTPNTIFKLSIHSITWLNSSSALISTLSQLQLLVPVTHSFVGAKRQQKQKEVFSNKNSLWQAALPLTQG